VVSANENPAGREGPRDDSWIQPPQEQEGLSRYVETLRERFLIVVITLALTVGVAVLYLATATKQYQGESDVLVTASSSGDPNLQGLPLIFGSSDPTRDVETASRLITNINVANRVAQELDGPETPPALLDQVTAEPIAQSNFVAVTATASSPQAAQDLANSFTRQAVAVKTEAVHQALDSSIAALQTRAQGSQSTDLSAQLAELQGLRSRPDPNLQVQTLATLPASPSSPRPTLTLVAGIFGGLVLGITAAFAFQVLDTRLRREEQLRRLYRLPILGRIPKENKPDDDRPLSPDKLSPATSEAYRTLRGTLAASSRRSKGDFQSILVTGSSPSEGKTTTGISLAASLAAAGKSVILIEADLRRPAIGQALDIKPVHGIVSVLIESVALEDALVTSPVFGANLGLLLADYEGGWITELFALPAANELIEEAGRMADYVIIDSPPLTDVIDALPLATYVDEVLIVVRLGKTQLGKLAQLGELLAENGIRPSGFAVIGTPRPKRSDYHYYADRERGLMREQPRVSARATADDV
jgi:capsular exopolysaccharide synthesis family protein